MFRAIGKSCALAALSLALPAAGRAESSALNWAQCVEIAREQHPGLMAARQNVAAAEAAIRASRAGRLPQLSASASGNYSDDSRAVIDGEETYRASVNIEQNLYDGGSVRSAVRRSEADSAVALAEARQTEADLLYALRIAFVDLLHAQAQIGLLEQIRLRRADNVEMVELRYEGGQEHQGSLALNRAALKQANADLDQARRALRTARVMLARALGGDDAPAALSVTGRFDDVVAPSTGDVVALARATPAYFRSVAARERAVADLDNARSGRRPTISAYGNAARYGDEPSMGDDNYNVGVRLTLDVWAGGRVGAEIQQAAARKMAADAECDDALLAQRAELEQTRLDYQRAWDAVAVEEQFLAAQDTRATIGRAQYGNGLLSFDNWDIMENDVISRQKSLLEARRQALRAEAAWWRAGGRGLDAPSGEEP